ncbi:hypothetical protein AS850_10000 [Frondihabitans sp. 762G35]|nr:hypothetical protein AS850_10000 [Frondihabitans sp. 762G35]
MFEADEDELVTGEAVGLDLRPAGFVLRLAGVAIDYVVYAIVLIGLLLLLSMAADAALVDESTGSALAIASVVLALVVAPTAIETATKGRSIGKYAVGARVVRLDGGAIGFRHAFTRALVGILEIVMTAGGLAVIVALLNRRSRRLGDLLAGTYALGERPPRAGRIVHRVPPELEAWSRTADVARLPDSLARRLSAFLQQAPRLLPESRIRVAGALAAEASAYVSPLPAVDAETFVIAVSAVRRDREARALAAEAGHLDRLAPALEKLPQGFPRR